MFAKRKNGMSVTFVGGYTHGQEFKNTIKNGDSVVLHIDDESIRVKNIELSSNTITGTVYGFEPGVTLEFNGIKIGDEIMFNEDNIFSCSSN